MTELVPSSTHPSPQPKRQIDRFSRFCTAYGRKSLYFTMGDLSPKIAPSNGVSGRLSNTWFLGPIRAHNVNDISIGSAVFAQMTAECPNALQWDASLPLKIAFSMGGGIWTPSNTWSGPTRVHNLNGISIASAVFAGLTSVTDQQTDRPRYSVGNNRPHTYVVLRCCLIMAIVGGHYSEVITG